MSASASHLVLDGVCKSFGALRVVDGISLRLAEGETLGILGPNGAGKTTLFNLISGDLRADAGTIILRGQDIGRYAPHRRCRLGIGRSYQIPQPWGAMTVFENLVAAASFGARKPEAATYARAVEILGETGLLPQANRPAAALRLLDRKRLELARALGTGPSLLLLDEIGGGLTDAEATELVDAIQELQRSGIGIVWIEHIVHVLVQVAERLICMNAGKIIADGNPATVMANPEVVAAYLGGAAP